MVKHNELRDQLFRVWPLKPRSCAYCGEVTHFPKGVARKEQSFRTPSNTLVRPDISIWLGSTLVATVEVIDTNLSAAALDVEQGLPNAFFFHVKGGFWCSPECYKWAQGGLERKSPLPECISCQRLMIETAYPRIELVDWDAGDSPICIECAVQDLESQYVSPGEAMAGASLWAGPKSLEERFMALVTSFFWTKIWCERTKKLNRAWSDETATSMALDSVEVHFVAGYWEYGAATLASIGAPAWSADRDDTKPLYAWDPANCLRTAKAWIRLYEYRVGQMPADLRALIRDHDFAPCEEPSAICDSCGETTKNPPTRERPEPLCDACLDREEAMNHAETWEERRALKWQRWSEGEEGRRQQTDGLYQRWREDEEARIQRAERMLASLRDDARPNLQ